MSIVSPVPLHSLPRIHVLSNIYKVSTQTSMACQIVPTSSITPWNLTTGVYSFCLFLKFYLMWVRGIVSTKGLSFFLSCLLPLSHSKQISKTSSWPIEEAYPWLLVLLTDLDKANQDKLAGAGAVQLMLEDDLKIIRNTTLETISKPTPMSIYIWLPSRWLLRSISQQGTHQDSISNIHALAVMAFRSGFP